MPTGAQGGKFKEDALEWTAQDVRYTAKGDNVYAFVMAWPDNRKAVLTALASHKCPPVGAVQLLGCDQPLTFEQTEDGLTVHLPPEPAGEYAHGIRVMVGQGRSAPVELARRSE